MNIDIYLEIGKKRTFAGALDWPGWCRSGRDEASALQALVDYGARYASVLRSTRLGFKAPSDPSALAVVERLEGNMTTDFGAPDIAPASDQRPMDKAELHRFETMIKAYWRAFDKALEAASGVELSKGPRGGGRDLEGIAQHVLGVEKAYLARLGWKAKESKAESKEEKLNEALDQTHKAVLNALAAALHGELPERGPRGGVIWKPRYFVRRMAWHVLDHVWEIEDRASLIDKPFKSGTNMA